MSQQNKITTKAYRIGFFNKKSGKEIRGYKPSHKDIQNLPGAFFLIEEDGEFQVHQNILYGSDHLHPSIEMRAILCVVSFEYNAVTWEKTSPIEWVKDTEEDS
jgi:hypothetical protein